jgi:hypothetical protein
MNHLPRGLTGAAVADEFARMSGPQDTAKGLIASIARRGGVIAAASRFDGMPLADLAVEFITARDGARPEFLPPDQLFRSAFQGVRASGEAGMMTTGDFGSLLGEAIDAIVVESFNSASANWRMVAQTFNLENFRPKQVRGGYDLPDLEPVLEHGEVTLGVISQALAQISLQTFAKGFAFSRQAILNNDLEEFTSDARAYGVMAARSLSGRVWRLFQLGTTAAIPAPDGTAWLSAAHGNLAPVPAAITLASLTAGEAALMTQGTVPGRPFGLVPKYLLVGINRRAEALTLMNSQRIGTGGDVTQNRFYQAFQVIYEPSFPPNAWALLADPAVRALIAVPLLGGQETPAVTTEAHFDTFGVKVRVALDYEAAPIDTIGVWFNAGV